MSAPAPRARLHAVHLAGWLCLGAATSLLDRLHSTTGITLYANPLWLGERLPLSPNFAAAGVLVFIAYASVLGLPDGPRGLLGGAPLTALRAARAAVSFALAYALPALLARRALADGPLPFVCGALLLGWGALALRRSHRRGLPAFAALVACAGVLFEWIAVERGGYAYGVCPSAACAGTPLPIAWLAFLYLHAAIFVSRLLDTESKGPLPGALEAGAHPNDTVRDGW